MSRTRRWPEYGDYDVKRMFQLNRMDWIWMDQTPFGYRNVDWINRTTPYLHSAGVDYNGLNFNLPKKWRKGFNKQQKNNIYNDFWFEGTDGRDYLHFRAGFKKDKNLKRPMVQTDGSVSGRVAFDTENLINRPICLAQR